MLLFVLIIVAEVQVQATVDQAEATEKSATRFQVHASKGSQNILSGKCHKRNVFKSFLKNERNPAGITEEKGLDLCFR